VVEVVVDETQAQYVLPVLYSVFIPQTLSVGQDPIQDGGLICSQVYGVWALEENKIENKIMKPSKMFLFLIIVRVF